MFPIGFKILCDGYVIIRVFSKVKTLIINNILCDGYVIIDKFRIANTLIIKCVFMSWLCHYWLSPIFNSQAGMFFVPLYCQ